LGARGYSAGDAAEKESLNTITQTGSSKENAIGPPFFSELDQLTFWFSVYCYRLRAEALGNETLCGSMGEP